MAKKKQQKDSNQELHPSQVEALEQLAEAKEKLDDIPLEELKEIANWPLDSDSTEDVVMVGHLKSSDDNDTLVPTPNLEDVAHVMVPTKDLTESELPSLQELSEMVTEMPKEWLDDHGFDKPTVENDELYRAMVEDGLIIDASEEIVPRVDLDDEWAKYLEEHASKLPPVAAIVHPFADEPVQEEMPKRVSPIQFKQPPKPASPATVQARQGVPGVNKPRFYGGR